MQQENQFSSLGETSNVTEKSISLLGGDKLYDSKKVSMEEMEGCQVGPCCIIHKFLSCLVFFKDSHRESHNRCKRGQQSLQAIVKSKVPFLLNVFLLFLLCGPICPWAVSSRPLKRLQEFGLTRGLFLGWVHAVFSCLAARSSGLP
jgi:hypothetical protein